MKKLIEQKQHIKGTILELLKEKEELQNKLFKLEEMLVAERATYNDLDRQLALVDGRYSVTNIKEARKPRTRKLDREKKLSDYTADDLVRLLKEIPETRRKGFIEKFFSRGAS